MATNKKDLNKANYTFVQKEDGTVTFRSKVTSFNLDHVTDKDLASFYMSFSNYAMMDTGLLPVDGTGLLAIRKAGDHTQVVYQHKPGLYYLNWGQYEKDIHAKKYLVAQPYRIVIIDFLNDNLLGARTFYSPVPATHPNIPLYHVNLPNINCKGYRGNAVGWICLYHNEDWSELPFNERLARALDRCSGTEAYNDQNMSETDGPNFYRQKLSNDSTYSYLWDPTKWEKKSLEEGFEWTLSSDIWIPVMVNGIDDQGQHDDSGEQLTLKMAVFGNYQAYYTDKYIPKPINSIERDNFRNGIELISKWFTRSFASADTTFSGIDPFSDSLAAREENINNTYELPDEEEDYYEPDPDDEPNEDDEPF